MSLSHIRPDQLYAWRGPSLLIANTHGACGTDQPISGYYYKEARFLRTCRLELDGEAPWLCEAVAVSPDRLDFTYTYPEVAKYGGGGTGQSGDDEPRNARGLPQRALNLWVVWQVGVATLEVVTTIDNCSRESVEVEFAWVLDTDFADIQEAQSGERRQEAPIGRERGEGALRFHYGHESLPLATSVTARSSGTWTTADDRLSTRIRLAAGARIECRLRVVPSMPDALSDRDAQSRQQAVDRWRSRFARVTAPGNRLFEDALARNIRDIASFPLMDGSVDEWLTLQAGVPLYPALFGRDAITAGWQAGYIDCGAALAAALTRLGRLQTDRTDDWRDEEPGRIPYQVRTGPLARLNINPYARYYADFASPLMFVISLANLFAWTGERHVLDRHWDTARRILDWARTGGDADGDGYLEYHTRSSDGTKNQGWKDSGDAIIYDDGSPVPPPIATCELQGYWYAAQHLMGALCWVRGEHDDAKAHFATAADLKRRFNADWWIEDLACPALALDPAKRPVAAATSNAGHCLATGIIDREHVPALVGRLFAPDMFSGWGIRTLSSTHRYYNPLSYHRGTVWPVEQGTIVFGLRRYGCDARAQDLAAAVFDLCCLYPEYRIPECVGGYARGERPSPAAYPQANAPQLWNATAFPLIVQSLLGLVPLAPFETLVVDPALPDWLPDLTLHDLRVGSAAATIRFWRAKNGTCDFEVLSRQGTLRILRQPPPESLDATLWDRFAALM